jgi:hypothetical protein
MASFALIVAAIMLAAALVMAAVAVWPASAATITENRLAGDPFAISADEFTTRSTTFNTQGSVTTGLGVPADGRRAILKGTGDAIPDGRFNEGNLPWVDSADIGELERTVNFGRYVHAFGFGVTDANDQAGSWWSFTVDGATASISPRANDEGEAAVWYTVLFDKPTKTATFEFSTRPGDGYGIMQGTVAPVPLPAGVWLMLAAMGALGLAKRRARG